MTDIFISYRREDVPDAAGRIFDRLSNHFGAESVFFDIDSVPLGIDFRKHVEAVIAQCDILLVIIGDNSAARSSAHCAAVAAMLKSVHIPT